MANTRSTWIESGVLHPAGQAPDFDQKEVGYVRRFVNPALPTAAIYVHFFTFPTTGMRPAPPAAFYPGRSVHFLLSTDPERPFTTAEWQSQITDRSFVYEGDRGYQSATDAEIDAVEDAIGFDPAWLDWQGNRFDAGPGPKPTSTRYARGCEHFFPAPEELGYDPESFPGGPDGRGNCTVCRMTWAEFHRLIPESALHLFSADA